MITATFPTGVSSITVNGLHQWDYGQTMQIHADDLPSMIEVHFACIGMNEALVRSCSMVGGVGAVTIPDKCLEQSAPIYAWIYEINGTVGATTKTIVLNVTPRTRPQPGEDIPVEISDKYTEALTALNDTVEKLEKGEITVKEAETAQNATQLATHLADGTMVVKKANNAETATTAENATQLETNLKSGKTVVESANFATYSNETHTAERLICEMTASNKITKPGLYVASFHINDFSSNLSDLLSFGTSVISIPSLNERQWGSSCLFVASQSYSGALEYDPEDHKLYFRIYHAFSSPVSYVSTIAVSQVRVIAYY